MLVRVDKCHSFGILKKGSIAAQYKPKLYIDNKLVSPTGIDEHFTYLGCHFDFKMSDLKHKENLIAYHCILETNYYYTSATHSRKSAGT